MAYPTRADLVAESTVAALTDVDAVTQDGFYEVAKRAVEAFCDQRFDHWDETRTVDGTDQVRLPLEVRLATLTSLVVAGASLDASDVSLSPDHDLLYVTPDAQGGGTWATRVMRAGRPPAFTLGPGTVTIEGTWGWLDAEFPAAVGDAMRLDMEDQALAKQHGLAATVRAQARLGLSDVSEGSLSATINAPDVVLSADAQTLLEPYIWQPVGFGA